LLALTLGLALLFDSLFLIYQTLLWPCSSCHVVALLIGVSALAGLKAFDLPGRKLLIGVGVLWSIFFIYISVAVVKEIAFKPWPIYGSVEAPVKIYFSPTCDACEEVVRQVLSDEQAANQTGFYPIAKNKKDESRLAKALEHSAKDVDATTVLELFSSTSQQGAALNFKDRLRLLSNKMVLAKSDATRVPLIVSPHIIEIDRQDDGFVLPIENLWGSPVGTTPDTGCSAITDNEDCEQ
jgi:arsenate reductase-like glutaredoxin family protein